MGAHVSRDDKLRDAGLKRGAHERRRYGERARQTISPYPRQAPACESAARPALLFAENNVSNAVPERSKR